MTERHTDRVYVIKYAMSSKPTLEVVIERCDDHVYLEGRSFHSLKIGRDVADSREEAVRLCKAARNKKIASLIKQIAKLEKMDFEKLVPAAAALGDA